MPPRNASLAFLDSLAEPWSESESEYFLERFFFFFLLFFFFFFFSSSEEEEELDDLEAEEAEASSPRMLSASSVRFFLPGDNLGSPFNCSWSAIIGLCLSEAGKDGEAGDNKENRAGDWTGYSILLFVLNDPGAGVGVTFGSRNWAKIAAASTTPEGHKSAMYVADDLAKLRSFLGGI